MGMAPPFDARKPPPTARQAGERTRRLVVFVAAIGLALAGFDRLLPAWPMALIWWTTAALVGFATMRIEKYMARREGLTR